LPDKERSPLKIIRAGSQNMAQPVQKQMTSLFELDGKMDGRNSCKNCVQVNNYSAHKVVSQPNQSLQSFP
jgi:hypothetical protein